jgi:hypothetical protein
MNNIAIIGSKGNMGRRYRAILDYLQIEVQGLDVGDKLDSLDYEIADGFIVASPTFTHEFFLNHLGQYGKPILCEKPILIGELDPKFKYRELVRMVNQYEYLIDKYWSGDTYYNYYKSGGDGLAWDTINILGLSKKRPELKNDSPIWKCQINGKPLSLADMDSAYIKMVMDWTKNKKSNWEYAVEAHRKVLEWLKI